jgi:spore maturation protein CgeB
MKVLVIGKTGGVTNWEPEVVAGLSAAGHVVEFRATRNPKISPHIERLFLGRIADNINRRIDRFKPDMILAVGGWGVEPEIIARIADRPNRPPLVGWVGDLFDARRVDNLNRFDALGYTDTGLIEAHNRFALKPKQAFIPHAADLEAVAAAAGAGARRDRMVFVGNPTAERRALVAQVEDPVALYGLGWADRQGVAHHETHGRRVLRPELAQIYATHFACLNIRNEHNVVNGLNQRNFSPFALGCAVVSDHQKDMSLCFDIGSEVLVHDSPASLNALYREILASPSLAHETAARGRARVLADHTYDKRLRAFQALLGLPEASVAA